MARPRRRTRARGHRPEALAEFQAGIRKRYTDEQILAELRDCAARLGRSPTMREFAADPETTVHPQTVIEHFGSWNAAKRKAGLVPRRFATREELLGQLRASARSSAASRRRGTSRRARGSMPSKSLLWHTFGSLARALREAGFDVPVGEERLERAVEQGAALARRAGAAAEVRRLGRARREADAIAPDRVADLPHVRGPRGAWSAFQFLSRERLLRERGPTSAPDGRLD